MAPAQRRLLHLVTRNERRGAESAALELHKELVARGWDSRIAALAPPAHAAPLGVESLGPRPLAAPTLLHLRRLAEHADLVIGHGSSTLPAMFVTLGRRVPFVYVNIGDPRAWQTSLARRIRSHLFLGRAHAVVAISPTSARLLSQVLGVPPTQVTVIPNFRSGERFQPTPASDRASRRRHLGLPETGPLVLYLGALTSEKRPDRAILALSQLREVTLVMVGDGPQAGQVARLAADLGLDDRVRQVGSVSDPVPWLSAADAVVLSSDTEGVPGALIEAGLSGLPCASTDVGFVRDVVVDGKTGRLATQMTAGALATAISDVLAHPEYGRAARSWCLERFERTTVIDAWESFLTLQTSGDS